MQNIGRSVLGALNSVFGPCITVNNVLTEKAWIALTATGVVCPSALYSLTLSVTGNQGMDFRLIDASATGITSPVQFQIEGVAHGVTHIDWARPVRFHKGIVIQCTATGNGTSNISVTTQVGGIAYDRG